MFRYTDTRSSPACRVYEEICALTGKIRGLKLEADFTEEMRDKTADLVEEKWNYIQHGVHSAGYALDPPIILVGISSNTEVLDGFMRVLDRLCTKEEKKQAFIGYSYTSKG